MAEASKATGASRNSRLLRLLDSVPTKWWFFAVVALVLAASAIFGGLEDATTADEQPPVLSVGETFVGPELTTTILGAELTDTAPGLTLDPDDGNTYLVVTATVTNNWRTSTTIIRDLLQLEWLKNETEGEADRNALLSDGTSGVQAHPGVPTDVAWIWEVPIDELAPGDTISVAIRSKTLTEDGDVTYGSYWSDPVVAARVDVEVEG